MAPLKHGRIVRPIDGDTSIFWDATVTHPDDDASVDEAVQKVVTRNRDVLLKTLRDRQKRVNVKGHDSRR